MRTFDKAAWQRRHRAATGDADTKRYEKTRAGFLMRAHRNMRSRVLGIQRRNAHLYVGKDVLPREEFYQWALSDPAFHVLFTTWEQSGYPRQLAPSVNRIDPLRGYTIDNIEWITHSQNSAGGGRNRWARS